VKIIPSQCPECGEYLIGFCDMIPGTCLLDHECEDEFEYNGETKLHYDDQYTEGKDGKLLVICDLGHQWPVNVEDGNETD
jgi:hypothetical protein